MIFLVNSLEDYMLPCLWKATFGFECLGCGMQRSISLLLRGDFIAAFKMYPAIYTLISFFGFLIIHSIKPIQNGTRIMSVLALSNFTIIIISYLIKHFLL